MANRRVLVKRRKAVGNIRKITRTMQLIATARFQSAHRRALASRPYSDKLGELLADLSRAAGGLDHPLMRTQEGVDREALVVLTGNRGLCGGHNANVLRQAVAHLKEREAAGRRVDVTMVGKKGIAYFRFLRREVARRITDIEDRPRFQQVEPIADSLIERFLRGEIAAAHVAYMRFHSAGKQVPTVLPLLPIAAGAGEAPAAAERRVEYELSPSPRTLLDNLLPAAVRMRLYGCFIDAAVSEQVARMVAMKAATDAANDMIRSLTRRYNRARQTHITMELLDIIGGASALE